MQYGNGESSQNGHTERAVNGAEIVEHAEWIRFGIGNHNPAKNDRLVLSKLLKVLERADKPIPHAKQIWENYFCSKEGDHQAAAAITQHLKNNGKEDLAWGELNEYILNVQSESTRAALDIAGAYAWIWEDFTGARQVVREFTPERVQGKALAQIDHLESTLEEAQTSLKDEPQTGSELGKVATSSMAA